MLSHIDPSPTLVFLSKVVEKVVDVRLSDYMNRHHLLPVFQSAYRIPPTSLDRDRIS